MIKIQKTEIVGTLSAVLNPLIGIITNLGLLASGRRPSWIALSFSLALIYSYAPLLWDSRNNFYQLYRFKDLSLNPYSWALNTITQEAGLPFIFGIFILGWLTLFLFLRVVGEPILKHQNTSLRFLAGALLLIACVEFRFTFDVQKTSLATALFVLAISIKHPVPRWSLVCLAVLVHPFIAAPAALLLVAKWSFWTRQKLPLYALTAALLLFSVVITPNDIAQLASDLTFLPVRLVGYLSNNDSRYSSETIATLVWFLRAMAGGVIATATVSQLSNAREEDKWLLRLLIGSAFLLIAASRQEVLAERLFFATVVIAAFVCVRVRFGIFALALICTAVLINVCLHGAYTLMVVFGETYEIIPERALRLELFARSIYLPSPLLLNFDAFGYSNQIIFSSAPPG